MYDRIAVFIENTPEGQPLLNLPAVRTSVSWGRCFQHFNGAKVFKDFILIGGGFYIGCRQDYYVSGTPVIVLLMIGIGIRSLVKQYVNIIEMEEAGRQGIG